MADTTNTNDEVLVLTDNEGNYYAIPRATLDQHRLTGEQKAKVEELVGGDVEGYTMDQWYMRENLTSQYQSERRQEAARERMLRKGVGGGEEEESGLELGTETRAMGMRGVLTGMFTSLRTLSPDWSK